MKKWFSFILAFVILTSIVVIPIESSAAGTGEGKQGGVVSLTSGRLNVRAAPSISGKWLASLSAGTVVTLYEKNGEFFRVEYGNGKMGYCHADYIKPLGGTPATVSTGGAGLNIRKGPGTSYARLGSLAQGEEVLILSQDAGWARVLYRGTGVGYVSLSYLRSYVYPAVSLTVPCFRQTDSRWSWRKVGASGKTLGQIGCATTGIAMMESYRTGKTQTPADMLSRLTYTASGNVYWPSYYRLDTTYSLVTVYRHLSEGKPVLLGAKRASGGQHWVVVTGCYAGNALTPACFTIHDPAVPARKTLADLFAQYPYFYKMFTF